MGSRDLLGGIRHAQVVDGSTLQQVGREGLLPMEWEGSWYIARNCRSEEMSVRKMSKNGVSRNGFAGCGKCSHTPWRHFARIPGVPRAKKRQNQHFRGFWGSGRVRAGLGIPFPLRNRFLMPRTRFFMLGDACGGAWGLNLN